MARTGVGKITVVDLDMVAESNTNRQIHALGDLYGKAKVDAIAERIRAINPDCEVSCIEDFVTPDNVAQIFNQNYSVVIDAIDQVRAKAASLPGLPEDKSIQRKYAWPTLAKQYKTLC